MIKTPGNASGTARVSLGPFVFAAVLAALPAAGQGGAAGADGANAAAGSRGAPSSPVAAERPETPKPAFSPTQSEGPWGAIAFWTIGSQWLAGAAANYDTPLYAEFKAREPCGGDQCNMAMTFRDECAALAVSVLEAPAGDVVMEWAKAGSETRAGEAALGKCRARVAGTIADNSTCAVEISVCSGNVADAGLEFGAAAQLPPEIELDRAAEAAATGGAASASSGPSRRAGGGDPLRSAPTGPAGMEFVWIPAGEFRMGSTSGEAFGDEQPVTSVRISEGFWLGKYEVTQAEWQSVMGSNPSRFSDCGGNCPVEQVSWEDVQEFIGRLNAQEGGEVYRLPTEAEWEYAARAGTTGDRYGSLDGIAWYRENSSSKTHPVGGKTPNAWGLYDMLGNVLEWVEDWFGDYPGGAVTDPLGPGSGSDRVLRGGNWNSIARGSRASFRFNFAPGYRDFSLGFRLLRTR